MKIDELDMIDTHWNNYKQDYTTEAVVLSGFLGVALDEAEENIDSHDYLVLTDNEADDAVRWNIEQSVWAFNASFLSWHTGVDEEAILALQQMAEGGNDALTAMIRDFDFFVDEAVASDGRGHFLAGYDHEEHEVEFLSVERNGRCYETKVTNYYIYRRN